MKLWSVQTGKCLYTWEFPTAVKRVAWKYVVLYLAFLLARGLPLLERRRKHENVVFFHRQKSVSVTRQKELTLCLLIWNLLSEDDSIFLSITEQRSGYAGAIRVHRLNRDEPERRASLSLSPSLVYAPAGFLALSYTCSR